jgi:hypothetical protein
MRTVVLATVLLLLAPALGPESASARCACRCIDGEVKPLCDSALEPRPVCPARACPTPPAAIPPIDQAEVPPPGTRECHFRQLLNRSTGLYDWVQICE